MVYNRGATLVQTLETEKHRMKIAYLILAHHQPSHLGRLVSALSPPSHHCFVHVDAKSDISEFCETARGSATLLEERITVSWGGFSQSQAAIALLAKARETQEFDYYALLSRADYPIKPAGEILDFFERRCGQNSMNFYPLTPTAPFARNIAKYYNVDLVVRAPRLMSRLVRWGLRATNLCLPRRRFVMGLMPYRGSAWSAFHRDAADYVLEFLASPLGKRVLRFFRYSWGADEMLFQTVVLNSPHAGKCRYFVTNTTVGQRNIRAEEDAYLHYIDWSCEREQPAVLVESDLAALQASEFLFARKFDEVRSAGLLDQIDRVPLKREPNASH